MPVRGRRRQHLLETAVLRGSLLPSLFEYSINVSLWHHYLYMEVPKVGCSTIKATLHKYEWEAPDYEFEELDDVHMRDISPLLTPRSIANFAGKVNSGAWYQFAFVRNPFERLLSVYLDKIVGLTPQRAKLVGWIPGLSEDPARAISFAEFVDAVCRQPNHDMDNHWRPQSELLCWPRIRFDRIGRMESFTSDFSEILGRIGCPGKFFSDFAPHGTGSASQLRDYYTDALVERVRERYRDDFDAFDYPVEFERAAR